MMPSYPPPVDRLKSFRPCEYGEDWADYPAEFGLGSEHVPDLIGMVGDEDLYESQDELAFWATIHARRALGQLKAVETVGPLLEAMDEFGDYDDYWTEELAEVFAKMGPGAIPGLAAHLGNRDHDVSTRIACSSGLREIGLAHPETREECVGILTRQLAEHERDADDDTIGDLNGFLVSVLIDLKAVESGPVIEAAFAAGVVNEWIAGDWPRVRYCLGLGPRPPRRRFYAPRIQGQGLIGDVARPNRPDLNKLQKKRKAQKKARKRKRKGP